MHRRLSNLWSSGSAVEKIHLLLCLEVFLKRHNSLYLNSHVSHNGTLMTLKSFLCYSTNITFRFTKELLAGSFQHFNVLALYFHLQKRIRTSGSASNLKQPKIATQETNLLHDIAVAKQINASTTKRQTMLTLVTWAIPVTDMATPSCVYTCSLCIWRVIVFKLSLNKQQLEYNSTYNATTYYDTAMHHQSFTVLAPISMTQIGEIILVWLVFTHTHHVTPMKHKKRSFKNLSCLNVCFR